MMAMPLKVAVFACLLVCVSCARNKVADTATLTPRAEWYDAWDDFAWWLQFAKDFRGEFLFYLMFFLYLFFYLFVPPSK